MNITEAMEALVRNCPRNIKWPIRLMDDGEGGVYLTGLKDEEHKKEEKNQ